MIPHRRVVALAALAATLLWPAGAAEQSTLRVVATTTLLEVAVRDLLGEKAVVTRLLPAGSCPGHFDLEPSAALALGQADLLLRHDFQESLCRAMIAAGASTTRIFAVRSRPSFAIPSAYAALAEEIAMRVAEGWPHLGPLLTERLTAIRRRAEEEEIRAKERLAPHRGKKVLAAHYQRDLCRWAGLDVVGEFWAGADESAWHLARAVDMALTGGAVAVIGNRQWGERHLVVLAEACRLPAIMLSNFPSSGEEGAYWKFFEENIAALERLP